MELGVLVPENFYGLNDDLWRATLDQDIDIAGPDTKVIPSHGLEVIDGEEGLEFRAVILDIQGRAFRVIREGKAA